MKRNMIILVSVLLAVTLAVGGSIAMAAQPPDKGKPPHAGEGNQLIPRPNGFPAGPHFNLNIHGKKAGYNCTETSGGGSIFVDEYGPATIQYVTNKKSSVENLTVLDPCAVDNGTAKVQLPYEADGYFVFGRILGKPNHGQSDNASSVILYPNVVVQACNDTGYNTSDFANLTSCDDSLLALGFILYNQVYLAENETYVRFDPTVTKGKGKSKATDITALFTYTGWVVHPALDISGGPNGTPDGVINVSDIPVDDYDGNTTTPPNQDYNNDGYTNEDDVEAWLTVMEASNPPMAWYYDGVWIFNIADLVVTEQGLVNDGTKLLQIRFYPKDGTTFD
jgi:hypothetical protein